MKPSSNFSTQFCNCGNYRSSWLRLGGILAVSALALLGFHSTQAANQNWTGGSVVNGNWGTVGNWSGGAAPGSTVVTTNTDVATFNAAIANTWGNAAGNPIVIDSASQNIGGISFTLAAGNYFVGSTGGNTLRLTSGGTIQILAGLTATNAIETINAPLAIQGAGGTYTFANNSANGSGAGAGTLNFGGGITGAVAGATVLTLSGTNTNANTISGIIANGTATTMSITKSGVGSWTLSGVNTYTGVTTINAGTLSVGTIGNGGVAGNLGQAAVAAGNLVLGGGTLQYTGATDSTNRNFTLTAATTSTIDVVSAATNLTISGASTNTTGALTKIGAGTLTLSGANLYTGQTDVQAGTLAYGANNALSSGAVVVSGGTLDIKTFTDTVGAVTLSSGSINGTTGVLTGTSYAVQSGSISAILAGAVTLTKTTAGTVTLSGANTYTGLTTVSAGTLAYGASNVINTGGGHSKRRDGCAGPGEQSNGHRRTRSRWPGAGASRAREPPR